MKIFSSASGFTLVELLIATTVLALLVTASMNYFSPDRLQLQQAENTVFEIQSILREARALAITGAAIEIDGEDQVPQGGFGVFLDSSAQKAILFADKNANASMDSDEYQEETVPFAASVFVEVQLEESAGGDVIVTTQEGTDAFGEDFWITFLPNSGEVTFGSTNLAFTGISEDPSSSIVDRNALDIRIYTSFGREYRANINAVARFFEFEKIESS